MQGPQEIDKNKRKEEAATLEHNGACVMQKEPRTLFICYDDDDGLVTVMFTLPFLYFTLFCLCT